MFGFVEDLTDFISGVFSLVTYPIYSFYYQNKKNRIINSLKKELRWCERKITWASKKVNSTYSTYSTTENNIFYNRVVKDCTEIKEELIKLLNEYEAIR